MSWHHILPVIKDSELRLYSGYQDVLDIPLITNERKLSIWPEEYMTERPRYREGQTTFLNNNQIFAIIGSSIQSFEKDNFDFRKDLSGYDFDGQYLTCLRSSGI